MAFRLNKHLDVDTYYIALDKTCRVVDAISVVDTEDVASAAKTITLSDGTSDIGVITVANNSTEGTVDRIDLDATTKGKVALDADTPLKIVAAGSGNGEFEVTIVFDDFHADN